MKPRKLKPGQVYYCPEHDNLHVVDFLIEFMGLVVFESGRKSAVLALPEKIAEWHYVGEL